MCSMECVCVVWSAYVLFGVYVFCLEWIFVVWSVCLLYGVHIYCVECLSIMWTLNECMNDCILNIG